MILSRRRTWSRGIELRAAAAVTLLAAFCAAAALQPGVHPAAPARAAAVADNGTAPDEVRAMWVLRTSLTTPDHIASLVRTARDHGFNTLFVQVRGRGDAYFRGGVEPRPAEL